MNQRMTPHHEQNFPWIPKHTKGLELLEHLRRGKKNFSNGNRHHLFFEEPLFSKDPVLRMLRENPFCIVVIDHNWHRLIHKRFDRSPVPSHDVSLSFLDEARVTESWIRKMKTIRDIKRTSVLSPSAQDRVDELETLVAQDAVLVSKIEVMPFDMRALAIAGVSKMSLDPRPLVDSLSSA